MSIRNENTHTEAFARHLHERLSSLEKLEKRAAQLENTGKWLSNQPKPQTNNDAYFDLELVQSPASPGEPIEKKPEVNRAPPLRSESSCSFASTFESTYGETPDNSDSDYYDLDTACEPNCACDICMCANEWMQCDDVSAQQIRDKINDERESGDGRLSNGNNYDGFCDDSCYFKNNSSAIGCSKSVEIAGKSNDVPINGVNDDEDLHEESLENNVPLSLIATEVIDDNDSNSEIEAEFFKSKQHKIEASSGDADDETYDENISNDVDDENILNGVSDENISNGVDDEDISNGVSDENFQTIISNGCENNESTAYESILPNDEANEPCECALLSKVIDSNKKLFENCRQYSFNDDVENYEQIECEKCTANVEVKVTCADESDENKSIEINEDKLRVVVKSKSADTSDTEEDEQIPRIKRSSSLKTGKTPPGTPGGHKKIVRFADVLGLELSDVRTFLDEVPKIPKSAYFDLSFEKSATFENETPTTTMCRSTKTIVPMFKQPGGEINFFERLRTRMCCLENACLQDVISLSICGVVRVRNLDFNKAVHIRYTFDNWRSFADLQATYVPNSCDGFSDKFTFVLYCHTLKVGDKLQMAVKFQCKGDQYWDNNDGVNYVFHCVRGDDSAANKQSVLNVLSLPPEPPCSSDPWISEFY